MDIKENVPLKDHSTMRLGGNAQYFTEVHSVEELTSALDWAKKTNQQPIMIGNGSNIIWNDTNYPGVVLINKIPGFESHPVMGGDEALFTFGSGENWDAMVKKTVEMGYSGLEQLSLIPGTVGATPVQNVGAYGREIKDVLVSIRAYDLQAEQFVTLKPEDCGFGYRTSRFKTTDKNRFFIVGITVKLQKTNPTPPFYASLQTYLTEHNITAFTPAVIRDAVIAVRSSRLPNPDEVANNGSFFANPTIDPSTFEQLHTKFPDIPNWPTKQGTVKLSAAWMIEQAGFPRGYKDTETGMSLWKDQALVLVNDNARSTADLLKFKQKLVSAVETKFGVTLEQEPEII